MDCSIVYYVRIVLFTNILIELDKHVQYYKMASVIEITLTVRRLEQELVMMI